MNNTYTEFPYDKWKATLAYLAAFTPWWATFVGKFTLREQPGLDGVVMTSEMDILVDPDYVRRNTIPTISMRIEYSCEYLVRGMKRRFASYSKNDPEQTFSSMAKSMEINDSMMESHKPVNKVLIEEKLNKTMGNNYQNRWGELSAPILPEDVILSEDYGLEKFLSAEEYYTLLYRINNEMEKKHLDENSEQNDLSDDNDEDDTNTQDSDETPGNGQISAENNGTDTSSDGNNQEPHSSGYPDNDNRELSGESLSGEQDNSSPSSDDSNPNNQGSSENGLSGDSDDALDNDNISSADNGDSGVSQGSPENDLEGSEHGDDTSSQSSTETPGNEQINGENDDDLLSSLEDLLGQQEQDKHRRKEEEQQMEKEQIIPDKLSNNSSVIEKLSENLSENTRFESTYHDDIRYRRGKGESFSENDYDKAIKELAEDIEKVRKSTFSMGLFQPSNSMNRWSIKTIRSSSQHWTKVLNKVLSKGMSQAQMSGQSDISYSKRNPNQAKDAPIMMGFVSYSPEITILVDASPSMMQYRDTTLAEFTNIVKKVMGQYGNAVTWAVADTELRYVENSSNPFGKGLDNLKVTYHGGTDLGETILKIMEKGAKFKRRQYPKPQLLIIITDCLFDWPLKDKTKIPGKYSKVVVASTIHLEDLEERMRHHVPKWFKEGKTFVKVGEDDD